MTILKSFADLVLCHYCQKQAELVTGREIYGERRRDLWDLNFYLCRGCNAWVGCHRGTTKALGRLANAELRSAKQQAHAAFDPLWQSVPKSRSRAYRWLAKQLGLRFEDTHIGNFDLTQCRRVVEVCKDAKPFTEKEECPKQSSSGA